MKRLTSDNPKDNFETMLNMVYGKHGWQYIRHGEEGMPTVDFCLMLCKERGCQMPDYCGMDNGAKDEMLCDCAFDGCPVATVYAALSGFGHVRDRLRMYEDHDVMPDELERLKMCWHNCKIDCLLAKYNELKEKRSKARFTRSAGKRL